MRKLLSLSTAIAGLCLVALPMPAGAADRKADGLRNDQAVGIDLSAHRRRYAHRRYARRYYGPRYYYGEPYYYPRPYYGYGPGYYSYGYAPYPYYRRPGITFGFGF